MWITTYGTRGSSPMARREILRYGGNTTCLRIRSTCLPPDTALLVDAGTGIVPASLDLLKEGVRHVILLMTHYHHDHTQGFPLARHTYAESVAIDVFGPRLDGVGPRQVFQTLMSAPFFPVDYARVAPHITCHDLDAVGTEALLIHPREGARRVPVEALEGPAGQGGLREECLPGVALGDCLVVRMHKTAHPEDTVTYRFEERPTGKVAILLTDHENTTPLPSDLRRHLSGADLLIQDAQYTRQQYQASTAGFGHGTGEYSARVMKECGVARLGQTHHDPMADDADVDAIVEEARAWLADNGAAPLGDSVFACGDYQEIEV